MPYKFHYYDIYKLCHHYHYLFSMHHNQILSDYTSPPDSALNAAFKEPLPGASNSACSEEPVPLSLMISKGTQVNMKTSYVRSKGVSIDSNYF